MDTSAMQMAPTCLPSHHVSQGPNGAASHSLFGNAACAAIGIAACATIVTITTRPLKLATATGTANSSDVSRTEAALASLRELRRTQHTKLPHDSPAALCSAIDEMLACSLPVGDVSHALQTLVMTVSTQVKHPTDGRYHRLNAKNANVRRLLALSGAREVLRVLGFSEGPAPGVTGGVAGFWCWRDGALPAASDLKLLSAQRDVLLHYVSAVGARDARGPTT